MSTSVDVCSSWKVRVVAWEAGLLMIDNVGDSDITPLIPMLISLLTPPNPETDIDPEVFTPASDALQEIMTRSSLSGGVGVMSLTLPLLVWVDTWGPRILQSSTSCALPSLTDAIWDYL